jgi:hypothetical protein
MALVQTIVASVQTDMILKRKHGRAASSENIIRPRLSTARPDKPETHFARLSVLPPARACVPSHHRCTRSGVCLGEASGKRRAQPTSARLRHATVDIIQWAAAGARSLRTTACYSQPHSTLALSLEGESFHCFWASANAKKAHVDAHTQHPGLETSAHSKQAHTRNKRTEPRKEASRARHERTKPGTPDSRRAHPDAHA